MEKKFNDTGTNNVVAKTNSENFKLGILGEKEKSEIRGGGTFVIEYKDGRIVYIRRD